MGKNDIGMALASAREDDKARGLVIVSTSEDAIGILDSIMIISSRISFPSLWQGC